MEKKKGMKKIMKIAGIVLAVVVFVIGGCIFLIGKFIGSMNTGAVADYENRIEIWGTVAGNSTQSKLEDMNIDYNGNILTSTVNFASGIVNDKYEDVECIVDTFTYFYEIKGGFEKETYEDIPYLIPYLVNDSDAAVIVIPGGGFGYKSMDGTTGEGKDIAETLNKNGINAFVLHYRSNPYEYPIPYMDAQRAVRYLRYYSEEFHLDKNKISLIGFSAGGNIAGTYINTIQGNNCFPDGYIPDEIDAVDDSIASAAMIYPALSFRNNVPMLFCLFDSDTVRDEEKRKELLELTDLCNRISSNNVKQFIAYGTKDGMVGMDETIKYIDHAKAAGCDITIVEANGQEHGFQQKYYMNEYIAWLKQVFQ